MKGTRKGMVERPRGLPVAQAPQGVVHGLEGGARDVHGQGSERANRISPSNSSLWTRISTPKRAELEAERVRVGLDGGRPGGRPEYRRAGFSATKERGMRGGGARKAPVTGRRHRGIRLAGDIRLFSGRVPLQERRLAAALAEGDRDGHAVRILGPIPRRASDECTPRQAGDPRAGTGSQGPWSASPPQSRGARCIHRCCLRPCPAGSVPLGRLGCRMGPAAGLGGRRPGGRRWTAGACSAPLPRDAGTGSRRLPAG